MAFLYGFLTAICLLVAPVVRRPGVNTTCVAGKSCSPIVSISSLFADHLSVNVLIVHGMGADETTSYTKLEDAIARERLGFREDNPEPPRPLFSYPEQPKGVTAVLNIRNYWRVSEGGKRHLRFFEVWWWPLARSAKADIEDADARYGGHRALINGYLKKSLVDARVSDPIIYLSEIAGREIRDAVEYTICDMVDGAFDSSGALNNGVTAFRKCTVDPNHVQPPEPMIVITESLGSEIAYQSLEELNVSLKCDPRNGSRRIAESVRAVFMLANQLPLLRVARPLEDGSGDGTVPERCKQTRMTPDDAPGRQYIAISDPSDLLSYPLSPPNVADPNTTAVDRASSFINVDRSLGHRFLLGLLADPLGAHTSGKNDPAIQQMIACGYPKCSPFRNLLPEK